METTIIVYRGCFHWGYIGVTLGLYLTFRQDHPGALNLQLTDCRDPSIQRIRSPKDRNYFLQWATWIPRVILTLASKN